MNSSQQRVKLKASEAAAERLQNQHQFYSEQAYENLDIAMNLEVQEGQTMRALSFYDLGIQHIRSALLIPVKDLPNK